VIPVDLENIYLEDDNIDEQLLVDNLPEGFVPCKYKQCLLAVEDRQIKGASTGQSNLSVFRNWAKYFDSYSITLSRA
jgi:hypothetical protein